MSVAVLTDSTACLPPAVAQAEGIRVLPLHVGVGERSCAEGVDIDAADVARLLLDGDQRVTTSRPAPGEFVAAYRELAAAGASHVVSLHLSEQISGTVQAARSAASEVAAEVPVTVVDSRVLGMAMGYAAVSAARSARSGAAPDAVVAAATARAAASTTVFYLDSLEHLRRGGRVGTAQAIIGQALAIKPLLTLREGQVQLWERVRTRSRALSRLAEHAQQQVAQARSQFGVVEVAVQHLAWDDQAAALRQRLVAALGVGDAVDATPMVDLIELGAVTAVHAGPRTLAVVVSPDPATSLS